MALLPFRGGRVAVVEMFGVIGGAVRSPAYGRILDTVRRSRAVKAVVVDIDSPGGSATASEYLYSSLSRVANPVRVVNRRSKRRASSRRLAAVGAARQALMSI